MSDAAREEALFRRKLLDMADRADRVGYLVFSDFLDGGQRSVSYEMTFPSSVRLAYIGGYEDAERVVAVFYPSFLDYTVEHGHPDPLYESPLCALYIHLKGARFANKIPGHRDYLGSLMGLGIRREVLGDILPDQEGAVLIASSSIAPYIMESLTSVGRQEVTVEEISLQDITQHISDGQEMTIGVASERLDAVISKVFSLGRQDASKAITAGKVQVNWKFVLKPDFNVKEGDLISIRGFGRIRIKEQTGTSRSGRLKIRIVRFGS